MTTESAKKRNTTGPLSPYLAAARISGIIADSAAELYDVEKTVRAAIEKRKRDMQARIAALVARVPEKERELIAKLVLASQSDLCGFDLAVTANDLPASGQPRAEGGELVDVGEPEDFPDDLPPGARPMPAAQAERVARLTGKGRG